MPDTLRDRVEALRRAAESGWQLSDPYAVRELFRQRDALLAASERALALLNVIVDNGFEVDVDDAAVLGETAMDLQAAIAATREVKPCRP